MKFIWPATPACERKARWQVWIALNDATPSNAHCMHFHTIVWWHVSDMFVVSLLSLPLKSCKTSICKRFQCRIPNILTALGTTIEGLGATAADIRWDRYVHAWGWHQIPGIVQLDWSIQCNCSKPTPVVQVQPNPPPSYTTVQPSYSKGISISYSQFYLYDVIWVHF